MKKLALIIISALSVNLFGQISEGGLPPSYKNSVLKSAVQIPGFYLAELDTATLLAYDRENPLPMRYGIVKEVSLDIKSVGITTYSDSYKGTIWRYRIDAKNAKSIQLTFKKFRVPDRAQLFLYDENYNVVRGAFTRFNITDDLTFVIADFPGSCVYVEYFEPEDAPFEGELILGSIGQAYIDINEVKSINADSDNLINVNCQEGKPWQNQKHSVCKITFTEGNGSYLCSGALINNTANDGKPYFLTANHCISTDAAAKTVAAYFNYESTACSGTQPYVVQSVTGATIKSSGAESDYTLLLLKSAIPISYKPYFAGWDVTNVVTDSTAGIHHPSGKIKKISVDHNPSSSYESTISWEGGSVTPSGSHWEVLFDEGTTYGGSSGSPLFDENKRIIGQLHGGSESDYYGKLSYSWNHPGAAYSTKPLKSFLDSISTSATVLDGYYPANNRPDPQFLSDFDAVCVGSPVEISGFSAFTPTGWNWTFYPSTVEYSGGTSSQSQNPMVSFLTPGTYDAMLIVENSAGKDTLSRSSIITAGSILNIKAYPSGLSDSCASNFSGMKMQAYGADAYLWTLSETADDYFYIVNNTANPAEIKLLDGVHLTNSVNVSLTLTGTQGVCQKTTAMTIPLEAQSNDAIGNAIRVYSGKNGRYTNSCATIESGEPCPPVSSCTGQLSWCDEYNGKSVLDNSIWFYYIPETTQKVNIYSKGFDNQMAVYKAATYNDVLAGNYELIGANDDYTSTDFNPKMTDLRLTGGQPYWIQVDGSGGGSIGNFYLYITVLSGIEDVSNSDLGISVYPQPACDNVFIDSPEFAGAGSVMIELYNSSGAKVSHYEFRDGDTNLEIPMSGFPSGIYLARITVNDKRTTVKIVK